MDSYKKLKNYINDKCYSQSKIAKKLNKTQTWMANILNGKTKLYVEDYKRICDVMGVDCHTVETHKPDKEDHGKD